MCLAFAPSKYKGPLPESRTHRQNQKRKFRQSSKGLATQLLTAHEALGNGERGSEGADRVETWDDFVLALFLICPTSKPSDFAPASQPSFLPEPPLLLLA